MDRARRPAHSILQAKWTAAAPATEMTMPAFLLPNDRLPMGHADE
jgi:hypothetical protein